jgi:general stress protein 26
MRIEKFEDIANVFDERVRGIGSATATTVDTQGRPFSRMLHPIWEGAVGWIATGRNTLKTKHLAKSPHLALAYWTPAQDTVMMQCRAEWCDDATTKRHVWALFKNTPPPAGYDPGHFWPGGVDDATFGVLKLTPTRIELWTGEELMAGKPPKVWRA